VRGAGDGNRTRMTSLEGWSSTIELRPQQPRQDAAVTRIAYRLRPTSRSATSVQLPQPQRFVPPERVELKLMQELNPQSGLGQRRDHLADSMLELHAPHMLQGGP